MGKKIMIKEWQPFVAKDLSLLKSATINLMPYDMPAWVVWYRASHPTLKARLERIAEKADTK